MAMNRATGWLLGFVILSVAAGQLWAQGMEHSAARPNFVFILIDDLGWRDFGCYGSDYYETPHINRLAAQGMRFTNAYSAAPVCSPTRASIMTGRYPARLHLTDYIPGNRDLPNPRLKVPDWTKYLPHDEVTFAESLQSAGYRSASIGKWHLSTWGDDRKEYYPDKQGFNINIGGARVGQPPSYFAPYRLEMLADGPEGEYLTDRLTNEALQFMEANRQRPFFLYLAHHAVHNPIQAKAALVAKYEAKSHPRQGQNNPRYAAMVESVDESVGRIMARLDELGLADNTAIFLASDNGGLLGNTSNLPLRGGKHFSYEGGIRVPLVVRWPGHVPAGKTCDVPVHSIDFYPTILDWAGQTAEPGRVIDGVSLCSLLEGRGNLQPRALFWHYPHYIGYRNPPHGAVREGDYKLIEFFEDGRTELYNLREDLGEKANLAAQRPALAGQLRQRLADWRTKVGAQMPVANPEFDPRKVEK
jgi:arylsulfatase A